MKYLVTGGAGFVGSHLCERLISRGEQAIILDNYSTSSISNIVGFQQQAKVVEDNILNKSLVDELVAESDYVVHLAAALGVLNIVNKPLDSLRTNLQGTEVILEAANKHKNQFL